MASNTRRDVELVIRARNEASRAIESVSGTLRSLVTNQTAVAAGADSTGTALDHLASLVLKVGRAYETIDGAADRAAQSIGRQKSSLAASQAQYESLQRQIEAATRTLSRLRTEQDASNGKQSGIAAQIKAVEQAQRDLAQQSNRVAAAIQRQQAAIASQRSSLQELGSTAIAAKDAVQQLEAATALETQALIEQAEAARRASAAQARFNSEFAPGLAGETKSARDSAELLKVAAARDADRQAALEQGKAIRGAEEAQRRFNELVAPGIGRDNAWSRQLSADMERTARVAQEAATAEQEMAEKAARLRAQIDPLTAVQNRLNKELAEAKELYRAGKIRADELTAAENMLTASADRAARALGRQSATGQSTSLFNLEPHQLTNLSYQVNDVFTQLASGSSITQTLAQQGGQIIQIFPRAGAAIFRMLGPLTAIATVVAPIVLSLRRLSQTQSLLRDFTGALAASSDGAAYQAQSLTDATRALDRYGTSLRDAKEVITAFVKEGLAPDAIDSFSKAAKDMADVLGVDVADAAQQAAKAFTQGYEAVAKLDDQIGFLSASERNLIRDLFDSGRASDARRLAFEAFFRKMDQGAKDMRGPWSDAARNFAIAWDNLLAAIGNTSLIEGAMSALNDLSLTARRLAESLTGGPTADSLDADITRAERTLASLRAANNTALEGGIRVQEQRLVSLRAQRASIGDSTLSVGTDPKASASNAELKARQAILETIADERRAMAALTDQQKITNAGFEAERKARREGLAEDLVQAQKQLAMDKERLRLRKDINYSSLAERIGVAESNGRSDAKNPLSSATGLGQFIERTWLNLFRKYFPAQAAAMTEKRILELRRDAQTSKRMIEIYARENAELLRKAGVAVTDASLYLSHFLGPDGAAKILRAASSTPINQLLPKRAISANPSVLGGSATAGSVVKFAQRKVGVSDEQIQVANSLADADERRRKAQDELNERIDAENATRQQTVADLAALNGLTGEALLTEQKRQFVEEAVRKLRDDAMNRELGISDARIEATRKWAAAEFDAQNKARIEAERRASVEKTVSDLSQQRQALMEQITFFQGQGQTGTAGALLEQLDEVNNKLREGIAAAMSYWQAVGGPEGDIAILNLQNLQNSLVATRNQFIATGQQINVQFAQQASQAFDNFAQRVAAGGNVFSALGESFAQFAADFLRQIALMIIQQTIFNAISGGTGGGFGGFVSSIVGKHHSGGIAGRSTSTTSVPAALFANAIRYHKGGIAGLMPGEIPAILERGEEVLTRDDPRHVANGGNASGLGSPNVAIRQVLVMNPSDVQAAMASSAGERVIVTAIKRNAPTIKQMLGSK